MKDLMNRAETLAIDSACLTIHFLKVSALGIFFFKYYRTFFGEVIFQNIQILGYKNDQNPINLIKMGVIYVKIVLNP